MGVTIGRNQIVGIAKESTKGTAVAPAYWLPVSTFAYGRQVTKALDLSRLNIRANSSGELVARKHAEPTATMYLTEDAYGLLMLAHYGQVSSAVNETTAYDHTFTHDNDIDMQSLTLSVEDPTLGDQAIAGALLNSFTETFTMDDIATIETAWVGKYPAGATLTPDFDEKGLFLGRHVTVKFATTVAGLGAATAVNMKSVSLATNNNVMNDASAFRLGSPDIVENYGRQQTVEITAEKFLEDATYISYMIDADSETTHMAMQITITDANRTIGATSHPTIVKTYPKVSFNVEDTSENDEVRRENLSLIAHYGDDGSGSLSYLSKTIVTNEVTSY